MTPQVSVLPSESGLLAPVPHLGGLHRRTRRATRHATTSHNCPSMSVLRRQAVPSVHTDIPSCRSTASRPSYVSHENRTNRRAVGMCTVCCEMRGSIGNLDGVIDDDVDFDGFGDECSSDEDSYEFKDVSYAWLVNSMRHTHQCRP